MPNHSHNFYLTFDQLAERLGIPGTVIHVYRENDSDYVHIVSTDPTFPELAPGASIPSSHVDSPIAELLKSHKERTISV